MQVDDGVVQIYMAEEELNRSQVRPGFKEMGGVRMTHQMGRHAFPHPSALAGADTRVPHHLRGNRFVRAPVGDRARKQVVGGAHPATNRPFVTEYRQVVGGTPLLPRHRQKLLSLTGKNS